MPDDHTAPNTAETLFLTAVPARVAPTTPTSPGYGHLPTPLFEIAVASMWSDGALAARAVDRGHALARQVRSAPRRNGSPFGAIAAGPLPFGELDFDALEPDERPLAYAVALWVGYGDDQPQSARHASFARGLQLRLRLDDREAAMLRDVVAAVDATAEAEDAHGSLSLLLTALEPGPSRT
ncbi:MAG: hypothetical protein KUG77_08165 [Nannocystaceae bacterium]|nr:hypothetical protein [Nannocystaceae bacterium]